MHPVRWGCFTSLAFYLNREDPIVLPAPPTHPTARVRKGRHGMPSWPASSVSYVLGEEVSEVCRLTQRGSQHPRNSLGSHHTQMTSLQ